MSVYELIAAWSARGWPPLANHLWQATLFALLALAAASLLRRAPARARYHVWLLALVKFSLPSVLLISLAEQAGLDLSRLAPSAARPSPAASALPPILSPVSSPTTIPRAAETRAGGDDAASSSAAPAPNATGTGGLYVPLACVWAAGCAALSILWLRGRLRLSAALRRGRALSRGREFDALGRVRSRLGVRRRIGLVITPALSEPGVWRVWRPVVVLPEGVADQLDDAELEAVLMHEVAHVARHDNLAGNLQRALCCLFWFHPVVWLIGRRLLAEREQACDDAVVRLSGASEVYANSIAKVCGHCLGWGAAGASSFAGSDLKKRIERIASGRAGGKSSAPQRAVVFVAAAAAVTLSVASGQVAGGVAQVSEAAREEVSGRAAEVAARAPVRVGYAPAEVSRRDTTFEPFVEDDGVRPAQEGGDDAPAYPHGVETQAGPIVMPVEPPGPHAAPREAEGPPAQGPQPSQPSQQQQPSQLSQQQSSQPSQQPPRPDADAPSAAIVKAADVAYGDLGEFAGRYEVDPTRAENFVLDLTLERGELWLKPSHGHRRRLIRQTEADFSDARGAFSFTFMRGEGGRVVGLTLNSWGANVTARKLRLPRPSSAGNYTFRLKGYEDAKIVAVAGTFNNWNQSQLLFAREGDEWVCRVNLPPGTHQYKFIVDGDWLPDPANPKIVHDERGIRNSLLRTE
jgi:beta-lactamase regulating signal transducer with metallopeptidase domain